MARKNSNPSRTAELAAVARAEHTRSFARPIFEDPFAYMMCGRLWRTILSSRFLSWLVGDILLAHLKPITSAIYTRARFGEDCLQKAVEQSIDQYVIIGAGYDTFALRRPDLLQHLTLYELDEAATQDVKRQRIHAAGYEIKGDVHYVQSDLAEQSFISDLKRAGFDTTRPAVIGWFGVTYYLDKDTIHETLKSISQSIAPGSIVMFDYLADREWVDDDTKSLWDQASAFVARRGEPWVSSFKPESIPEFLTELGFTAINNLEPKQVGHLYFKDHPEVKYPPMFGFCHASNMPHQV